LFEPVRGGRRRHKPAPQRVPATVDEEEFELQPHDFFVAGRALLEFIPDGEEERGQRLGIVELEADDPPSPDEKFIKDLAADFPKYKWLVQPPVAIDRARWNTVRAECARRGHAFGVGVTYPGFHEWCELQMVAGTRAMELILAERPDYVLFGGSGTITLASLELVRRYALPALKKWSRMCRAAGVATVLHSCGKSRALVDLLAEEADVNCINPLEVAPMGDVDLPEVKRARGRQISLMGNLHTTDVMLRGARQALRDAGKRRRVHPVHRRPMWTGNARRQSLRARGNRAEIWRVRSRDRPTPR
jgi:hypothetical protein